MKKVLIMCTGNSCRSIMAEALINTKLKGYHAYSCGVNPNGKVHTNAKKVLEAHGNWNKKYYSKHLNELMDIDFDLVITVCDHAKEACPIFSKPTPNIHVGFEDPDGKEYKVFEATYSKINSILLNEVSQFFKEEA